jgi:hypothetical protein
MLEDGEATKAVIHSSSRRGFGFNKTDRPTVESSVKGHVRARATTALIDLLVVQRVTEDDTAIRVAAISCRRVQWTGTARPSLRLASDNAATVLRHCQWLQQEDQQQHNGRWIDSLDQGRWVKVVAVAAATATSSAIHDGRDDAASSGDGCMS